MKRAAIGKAVLWSAVAAGVLTGCQTVFDESDAAQARRARVLGIYPANASAVAGDTHCTDAAALSETSSIALVAYRLGRLSYTQTFAIPDDLSLRIGDTVVVHPRRCTLTGPLRRDDAG